MSFPFTVPLSPKEVITCTVNQRAPLGTRGATADGRIYRYAKAGGTALAKGFLCQSEVPANSWTNTTYANMSTPWLGTLGTTSVPITTRSLQFSATGGATLTIAKDYFKDGWLWVSGTVTSAGQMVKIKTHSVCSSNSSGTSGECLVEFEDGYALSEVIDTAAEVSMIKSEYDDVIVAPIAPLTGSLVGVPNAHVTASYYFWAQTWGACSVHAEAAAIMTGKTVVCSTNVAGTVAGVTASTDVEGTLHLGVPVGRPISSSAQGTALQASTNILVHLTIAP